MSLPPASTSPEPAISAASGTPARLSGTRAWLIVGAVSVLAIAMAYFGAAVFVPTPHPGADPDAGPGKSDATYAAGQAVEIWQNGRWLPGRIQAVGNAKYFVFYDGFSVSWNEWVGPARLRRVTAAGSTPQ